MVAIPHWLKTEPDVEQHLHRHPEPLELDKPRTRSEQTADCTAGRDIPIFCAGGCGEVVGYLPEGVSYNGKGRRCPKCEAASIARKRFAEVATLSLTSTDELAGLLKPPRDLRWLRLIQAAAVAVIIAGSVCIATGRVVGIYLAAFGSLVWFVSCFLLWKMRD